MVKALIELDNETNRILNNIKAKHGLKDKGHVIEFIAKRFNDQSIDNSSFKYLNDDDKWKLADTSDDQGSSIRGLNGLDIDGQSTSLS